MRPISTAAVAGIGVLLLVTGIDSATATATEITSTSCDLTAPKDCPGSAPATGAVRTPPAGTQPSMPLPPHMLSGLAPRPGGGSPRPAPPAASALTPEPARPAGPVQPIIVEPAG